MNITKSQLKQIMPAATETNIAQYLQPLNEAMTKMRIDTPLRVAAFIAQIAHESEQLSRAIESTYYSNADRLLSLFKNDFKDLADAKSYTRSPERCANRIYAKQNGNGNEASGDGWRYRGRGLIQITGRYNYGECGKAIGLDLTSKPELLESPANACLSAAWFWNIHGCNELADVGMFGGITKKINAGYNGAKERLAFYAVAKKALAI